MPNYLPIGPVLEYYITYRDSMIWTFLSISHVIFIFTVIYTKKIIDPAAIQRLYFCFTEIDRQKNIDFTAINV